ncbi:MAG: hypothetical protein L0Y58_02245 [Verrucomicrobia subdivision 3 bacterium]|nr:hypothetical protein [Limisphaerales bacterium]
MNEPKIAAALLTLLASGGTLERAVTDLPAFKAQIESAFDWMKVNAQCTAAEIERRANRLREVIRRKDEAVRNRDFDLAADMRAEVSAIFESLGLKAPKGTWNTILNVGIAEQIQRLSTMLHENPEPAA